MEPLLRADNKGGVYPWLAESYKLADDLLSITFTLRKGVKFHDGTDFDGRSAKWNLEQGIAAKSNVYWKSVDLVDDYTIKVNFTQWVNTLWGSFADGNAAWMISPTAFNKYGKTYMQNNPIGTGPFKFASFSRDVSYKTTRFMNYWKKDDQGTQLPYLDAFNFVYVADSMTQQAVMKSGGADMCTGADAKIQSEYTAAKFNIVAQTDSVMAIWPDTLHTDSPFNNKAVREATEYAINKEAMAKAFSYGAWEAPYQILQVASAAYIKDYTGARKYNPDKAKELLKGTPYPTGFKCTLITAAMFGLGDVVAYIQSDLAKVGIQAEIVISANPGVFNQQTNSITSMLALQPCTSVGNPNGALSFWFAPGSTTQMVNWARTPDYVVLYNKTMTSPTPDIALARAAYGYLQSEAQIIPIVGSTSFWAFASYVMNGGFCERGMFPFLKPEQLWLNK